MKTNKQEREAIAKKFYKRLQDKIVLRNEGFKKMSTYKELRDLRKQRMTSTRSWSKLMTLSVKDGVLQ